MHAVCAVLCAGLLAPLAAAEQWAVLVAGSTGYDNYRHQADVSHAYQLLTRGGVPPENVITMMADDAANSGNNKFPGKLFNRATSEGETPVDVRAGVKVDYNCTEVHWDPSSGVETMKCFTPAHFLAVLTGNASGVRGVGSGRVLRSGPEDHVFVNFVDHGGFNLIGFPGTRSPWQPSALLHAKDLIAALRTMHTKKMYKELVFYLEACESGSMFAKLPQGLGIYATTASNASQSSWGTYCPAFGRGKSHDTVQGVEMRTCLGDLYSVNWMENADTRDLTSETLEAQYEIVRRETLPNGTPDAPVGGGSHVLQFGDRTIAAQDAAGFEGTGRVYPNPPAARAAEAGPVDSRDIAVLTRFDAYMSAAPALRPAAAAALIAEVTRREEADALFRAVAADAGLPAAASAPQLTGPGSEACYVAAVDEVAGRRGWTDYSLKHARVLAALCDTRPQSEVLRAIRAHTGS